MIEGQKIAKYEGNDWVTSEGGEWLQDLRDGRFYHEESDKVYHTDEKGILIEGGI